MRSRPSKCLRATDSARSAHHHSGFGDGFFVESLYESLDFSDLFQGGPNDALLCPFISSEFSIADFGLIGMTSASIETSEPSLREEGSSRGEAR
jgi:hypothetical protein